MQFFKKNPSGHKYNQGSLLNGKLKRIVKRQQGNLIHKIKPKYVHFLKVSKAC